MISSSTTIHSPYQQAGKELPNEVLAPILLHLSLDPNKTSLARCMRVSTTFKALAAPLLYEKLDWNAWKEGLWPVVSKNRGNGRRVVQAESNVDDLRLIKTVEIQHHFVKDCPRSFGTRYRRQPLEIPILHIRHQGEEGIYQRGSYSSKAFCIQGVSCLLLAELAPRKIIVFCAVCEFTPSANRVALTPYENGPQHRNLYMA